MGDDRGGKNDRDDSLRPTCVALCMKGHRSCTSSSASVAIRVKLKWSMPKEEWSDIEPVRKAARASRIRSQHRGTDVSVGEKAWP